MKNDGKVSSAADIMLGFAGTTGLEPERSGPVRYLWTDSFAVCNYLGLYRITGDKGFLTLALHLIDQVHHVLGRHREDDQRSGWISGLPDEEGEKHPTVGGLRIGKPLNERKIGEPGDDELEWDRDGQYFHYLTKWMHALNRASLATRDPRYTGWAVELARTALAKFSYAPRSGGPRRMYWKMSIDLSYPQVTSMGQHDPLDGFVTYQVLGETTAKEFGIILHPSFDREIADIGEICRGITLFTNDPLGIGGLLFDATRIADLMVGYEVSLSGLLSSVLASALQGTRFFSEGRYLQLPASRRLAFRELGLSIGLRGAAHLNGQIGAVPENFSSGHKDLARSLTGYFPVADAIEQFWLDPDSQQSQLWTDHREINRVMLATSLVPEGFLGIP